MGAKPKISDLSPLHIPGFENQTPKRGAVNDTSQISGLFPRQAREKKRLKSNLISNCTLGFP